MVGLALTAYLLVKEQTIRAMPTILQTLAVLSGESGRSGK